MFYERDKQDWAQVTFRGGLHKLKSANSHISKWRTQAGHFGFRYF